VDVIIVCHTEFGFVHSRKVIFDKSATAGVEAGVINLINVAGKYGAKVTFAVMPEVTKFFPKDVGHEIGLHIHPGWTESRNHSGFKWHIGDMYLKENCKQSINSVALRDYPYKEQLSLIKIGKEYLQSEFAVEPKVFVSGKWSVNSDTVKALIKLGITHECSAGRSKSENSDWLKLPRICMPYHPAREDYQGKGGLPLLIVPISQMFRLGNVNPEVVSTVGLPWLKACFSEYYHQKLPLFHICLHSPAMTDEYFIHAMDEFLRFISKHDVEFKFASETKEYSGVSPKSNILPYLLGINKNLVWAHLKYRIPRNLQ